MLQFLDKQALGQSTLMGIIPDLVGSISLDMLECPV